MDRKPKVSGLSQAAEPQETHPVMGTSSQWPGSKAPGTQRPLFLPGGGKYYTSGTAKATM